MIRTAVCLVVAVLLSSSVVIAQVPTAPSTNAPSEEPTMYVATTTLMDPIALSDTSSPETRSARLAIVMSIARSNRVIRDAIAVLNDLGLKYSPDELMNAARVYPTGSPGMLAINVHLPDARQAKAAADVLASELKKVYAEIRLAGPRRNTKLVEAQVADLREQMKQAYAALDQHKRDTSKSRDVGELAVLEADAQIARDNYIAIGARLFDAKLAEQEAASLPALVTVDPAFVVPAGTASGAAGTKSW